ncbi:MAG: phosphatidylserine decarboxylase [Clostridia bacterium]|nr:phosphatidylserine decarboxylase [Clostridia bacterium]
MSIKIWNRRENKYIYVEQYHQKSLDFLYHTKIGRVLLKTIVTRKAISKIYGRYQSSKLSKRKIEKFIATYHIDMNDYEKVDYQNFNEFFSRKIKNEKRKVIYDDDILISCCDAKLTRYKIDENLKIKVKNSIYTIGDLIQDEKEAFNYQNGECLVFRLTIDDYHRYIFFDDGGLEYHKKINGVLHTVSSISKDYPVFSRNSREISKLKTKNFGEVLYIEVGALLVGKIKNYHQAKFKRGEEKGFFEFGGSTIILLFQENKLKIDDDIIQNSSNHIESKVLLGEKIGGKV